MKFFPVMQTIQTYLRCRPSSNSSDHSSVDFIIIRSDTGQVCFRMNPESMGSMSSNQDSLSIFNFKTVLGPDVSQEHVFEVVCTNVIESVLNGFNGTIFAYGQTGSGKTYTMTGSSDSYSGRGLIPRCLEKLFRSVDASNDTFKV